MEDSNKKAKLKPFTWQVRISKEIRSFILKRVRVYPGPYMYTIYGLAGGKTDMRTSAYITLEKLRKWAERYGGEVNLIEDRYNFNWNKRKWNRKGLLVEITDPVSKFIDELLRDDKKAC